MIPLPESVSTTLKALHVVAVDHVQKLFGTTLHVDLNWGTRGNPPELVLHWSDLELKARILTLVHHDGRYFIRIMGSSTSATALFENVFDPSKPHTELINALQLGINALQHSLELQSVGARKRAAWRSTLSSVLPNAELGEANGNVHAKLGKGTMLVRPEEHDTAKVRLLFELDLPPGARDDPAWRGRIQRIWDAVEAAYNATKGGG